MPLDSLKKFRQDTKASTAIEYALIAAVMGVAALAAGSELNSSIQGLFATIAGALELGSPDAPAPGPPIGDQPPAPQPPAPQPPAAMPPS